jgi:hypothetical protein
MRYKTPTAWKKSVVISKTSTGWHAIDPQATRCASIHGAPTRRECADWVRKSNEYRLKNGA